MLVDPILVKFLIAQIAYGPLKYLKISGSLRLPSLPQGALPMDPAWGFAPSPKFELHIAISPGQVRCTSTFFAAMPCTSELCNYISYQVEMVRYSHNVLSYGVLVTRFLHKQWHVTSHVFEVA